MECESELGHCTDQFAHKPPIHRLMGRPAYSLGIDLVHREQMWS